LPLPRGGGRATIRDTLSRSSTLGHTHIHVFGIQSSSWLLLAEAAKKAADPPARSPGLQDMLPAFAIIAVLFYFLILRPQKSKDQQFRSLVENLKETDRVVTIGGIYGVVTNVQREAGIVTLRVDESTGAKIRVNTSAIARVITDDEKEKKE
jgi:preprotein translocase subunit YajC